MWREVRGPEPGPAASQIRFLRPFFLCALTVFIFSVSRLALVSPSLPFPWVLPCFVLTCGLFFPFLFQIVVLSPSVSLTEKGC